MALASGLAAQFGCAEESTYGTGVTPTRFLEFNSEKMQVEVQTPESMGLRVTQRALRTDRFTRYISGGSGTVEFDVMNKGFGLIFKHCLGSNNITTVGTLPRLHTCNLADHGALNGLTVQIGKPDNTGTVRPWNFLGSKVTEWELTQELDDFLKLALTLDARSLDKASPALASASYATSASPYDSTQCVIQIAGSTVPVRKFSLKQNNAVKTDRRFIQGSGLKSNPIPNDFVEITGEVEFEYTSNTAHDRITSGTTAALTATWTGALIEVSHNFSITISLPAVRFEGDDPQVDGPDVVTQSYKFKALDDGSGATSPISLVYKTTDTTA